MMCPICGGNVYTDMACDGCNVTYADMIGAVRHDDMRRLMARGNLSADDEKALAKEIEDSSFLVPVTHIDGELYAMTVSDENGSIFIPIFTDKEEYDKNVTDIAAMTNPFNLVLDLLDERIEGFVINLGNEEFELNGEFLNRHFRGE